MPHWARVACVLIMLDHAFLDAISATRLSLEAAMLERVSVEEQFQTDVLLGDLNFETSYALPGNQDQHSSIVADLAMGWSSFSQAAMRSLFIGESPDEDPSVMLSVTFQVRDLRAAPDASALRATLSDEFPDLQGSSWYGPSLSMTTRYLKNDEQMFNFSISSDGEVLLNEDTLVNDRGTEKVFAPLGQWIASRLVKLSDYPFDFAKQPSRK